MSIAREHVLALEPRHLLSTANPIELIAQLPQGPIDINLTLVAQDRMLFVTKDAANGSELWVSDGTTAGTRLLKDINPGPADGVFASQINFPVLDGVAYFAANDGVHGSELWRSDGTEAGTYLVKDIVPGSGSSELRYGTVFGDRVAFAAGPYLNARLWLTDGTEEGTGQGTDVFVHENDSWIVTFGVLNDEIYFRGGGVGSGTTGIYRFNGSDPAVLIFPMFNRITDFHAFGNRLLFADRATAYVTDGTLTGTESLGLIGTTTHPGRFVTGGRFVYFAKHTAETGRELWRTDGTLAGTELIIDLNPGPGDGAYSSDAYFPRHAEFNGELVFVGNDGASGPELWKTDGTPEGTVRLSDTPPNANPLSAGGFVLADDQLFFRTDRGLGRTNATPVGTLEILQIPGDGTVVNWSADRIVRPEGLFFYSPDTARLLRISTTDTLPPAVLRAEFGPPGSVRRLRLYMSEDVGISVATAEPVVTNLDTGSIEPGVMLTPWVTHSFYVDAVFAARPNEVLPDGNYRLTLPAGELFDGYGNRTLTETAVDFFAFAGDSNRDRKIDTLDFAQIAARFNRAPSYAGADLDGSGIVDIDDFALFAPKFNTVLPPPPANRPVGLVLPANPASAFSTKLVRLWSETDEMTLPA